MTDDSPRKPTAVFPWVLLVLVVLVGASAYSSIIDVRNDALSAKLDAEAARDAAHHDLEQAQEHKRTAITQQHHLIATLDQPLNALLAAQRQLDTSQANTETLARASLHLVRALFPHVRHAPQRVDAAPLLRELERAHTLHTQLSEEHPDASPPLLALAELHHLHGQTLLVTGHSEDALTPHQAADLILERLLPQRPELASRRARLLLDLGAVHSGLDQHQEALQRYTQALKLAEGEDTPESQRAAAQAHALLGLHDALSTEERHQHITQANTLLQPLLERDPHDPELLVCQTHVLRAMGRLAWAQGKLLRALHVARKAVSVTTQLHGRWPHDPEITRQHGHALITLGTTAFQATLDLEASEQHLTRGLALLQPAPLSAHRALVSLRVARGELSAARDHAQAALADASEHPSAHTERLLLQIALLNVLLFLGDAEGVASIDATLNTERDQLDADAKFLLGLAYGTSVLSRARLGEQHDAALQTAEHLLTTLELGASSPLLSSQRLHVAVQRAEIRLEQGHPNEALTAFDTVIADAQPFSSHALHAVRAQLAAARARTGKARALLALGQPWQEAAQDAVAAWRLLNALYPHVATVTLGVSEGLLHLGELHVAGVAATAARPLLEESLEGFSRLTQIESHHAIARAGATRALETLARAHRRTSPEACDAAKRASTLAAHLPGMLLAPSLEQRLQALPTSTGCPTTP